MHRLLIVDDHPIYREGLKITLTRMLPDVQVFDVDSAAKALDYVVRFPETDLVLIDVRMPETDGFALLRQLGDSNPQVARVLISGETNAAYPGRAQALGAAGFLSKAMPVRQFMAGVRKVLDGGICFPRQVILEAMGPDAPFQVDDELTGVGSISPAMTLRQLEVLSLLAQGQSNKGIARALNISERTVKAHLSATFEFLGAKSRTQVLLEASRRGLLVQ